MFQTAIITEHSDTLIGLLTAQCGDLERLLYLARIEAEAAEAGNFETVLEIVSERSTLSDRLEVFSRQVAELRSRLGEAGEAVLQNPIAIRTTEIVSEILRQDARSRPLLETAKQEAITEISKFDSSHRMGNAYTRETTKGIAYSRSF